MTKNDALLPCQKETALENIESSMNLYDMPEHQDTIAVDGWALSELVDEVKRWRDTHKAGEFSPDYCAAREALAEHLEHCTRPTPAPLSKGDEQCSTCPYENYGPCPGCVHPDNTPSPVAVDAKAGEMQKLWQIVHVQDTPEDEAAFMVNMLRGQIKIPQSVKDRIYWAEHEKREALTAPKPDSKE